jgi:hypothetical protein
MGFPVRALTISARSWFVTVFAGQLIFAYYILMLYGRSMIKGDPEKWNTVNAHFYVSTDKMGTFVFGLHVALAAVITILGPLQLIHALRIKAPRFHRISGRIYIFTAFLISIAGLYLTWVKGSVGGLFTAVAITLNALIIFLCAFQTIRHAINRNIALHNQWAVHLFAAVSGVWFFRVFLMLWLAVFRAPVGFDPGSFTGPFLDALSIFVYVFPQVVVAFYFRAKRSAAAKVKLSFAGILLLLTLGIIIGTAAATIGMWLPRTVG